MIRPFVDAAQSRCLAGCARRDITPPIGVYHRMWGAATHDRSTGLHRPLAATALALAPLPNAATGDGVARIVWLAVDHCLLWDQEMAALRQAICDANGLAAEELLVAFSHTHAAGLMDPARAHLPGGELIAPYLAQLYAACAEAVHAALAALEPASISYGYGRSNVAAQRDYPSDYQWQGYVCGYNPAGDADDTLAVALICSESGAPMASVVNYACHPTTLAWENTLISPDYIGALREVVENAIAAPCVFLQGASGDLGPRDGYTGDVTIAERIGRQIGHAALAVLTGLPLGADRLVYQGAVDSGARLGVWRHERPPSDRLSALATWKTAPFTVPLPYRGDLPSEAQSEIELRQAYLEEQAGQARQDAADAQRARAAAERLRRQQARLRQLPPGKSFPMPVTIARLGDALWVSVEGEHYQYLQRTLRSRVAGQPLLLATNVNSWRPAYLPTAASYGLGIYQEQVAVLAAGSLEELTEAISRRLQTLLS